VSKLKDLFQEADWKTEKHVPVIDAPNSIAKGDTTKINVAVGKEIPHPNTTAHHIRWIRLYFHPQGDTFPYEIGYVEFGAHGATVQGPDTSTIYTAPDATFTFKTEKPGVLYASSYCNIHGLWENSKEMNVG